MDCKISTFILTFCITFFAHLCDAGDESLLNLPCSITTDDDFLYDLSPLAQANYFMALDDVRFKDYNLNFYMSVCHPLRNAPEHCSDPKAGVCVEEVTKNNTASPQRFKNLVTANAGTITSNSLKVNNQGWLMYVYTSGSACQQNGRQSNFTTYLNFICPAGERNSNKESPGPLLMSYSSCQFTFAWLSYLGCPRKIVNPKVISCIDKFNGTNDLLNIHSLHSLSYYNVEAGTGPRNRTYQVNICGAIESGPCSHQDATVCDVSDPTNITVLSTTADMHVSWQGVFFKLLYNSNTSSTALIENSQKVVEIKFLCDRGAHNLTIHFMGENNNIINFSALTSSICTPEEHECVLKDRKGQVFDLRPLHKEKGNWEVLDNRMEFRVSDNHSFLITCDCFLFFNMFISWNFWYRSVIFFVILLIFVNILLVG